MTPHLRQQFDRLAMRLAELDASLADPAVAADVARLRALGREQAEAADVVARYRAYEQRERDLAGARELLEQSAGDAEMAALARDEVAQAEADLARLHAELQTALLPKDPDDARNAFVEIRAGTGGDESALFAGDLARMYLRYCERRGWRTEVMSDSPSELGGHKELVLRVEGDGAYGALRFESGGHRVQRVPATESQGRIHTSTATVAVLAEMDDVDVKINESDLDIDSYRAGGAGGQHMQKNDTAIRITHKPTGMVVQCQDERSKTQNLLRAMSILRARLYEMELERQMAEQDAVRRSMVGSGERSEKIRTYNYPQNRVTDHRINLSTYNLPAFMDGELDEFIDELATRDQAERLQAANLS